MSQEWSGVVSTTIKEEYMTVQGRLQEYSVPDTSKIKSHLVYLSLTLTRVKLVAIKWNPSKKMKKITNVSDQLMIGLTRKMITRNH